MLATANTGKIGRGFGKNAGEWTGSVEINKEEIPGSKRSMYGKFGLLSPWKASCDKVALPNLRRMLGDLVFP